MSDLRNVAVSAELPELARIINVLNQKADAVFENTVNIEEFILRLSGDGIQLTGSISGEKTPSPMVQTALGSIWDSLENLQRSIDRLYEANSRLRNIA